MADTPISHENIEHAFRPAVDVLAKLPDSIERREAQRIIKVAEDLAHETRERHLPRGGE